MQSVAARAPAKLACGRRGVVDRGGPLPQLDADDAGQDQQAADQLDRPRELVEQQPGEQHAGDDLEQRDERRQPRAEAAAGGDAGGVGDRRR